MPTLQDVRQQYPQYQDMPDSALADALHRKFYSDMPRTEFDAKIGFSKPDTATDVAKSAGIGVAKGAIGLLGAPGDIGTMAGAGTDWAAGKLGITPEATKQFKDQFRGVASYVPQLRPFTQPGSREIQKQVEGVTGEFYKPQTVAGEYAQTVGEFAPAAAMGPGGLARRAVMNTAIPAIASETAGQATKGTKYEPYARAGAGVGASFGTSMLQRPAYSERLVGRAAEGVQPQQYAQAEQLMRDAHARGIQLTPAEAIQQATGSSTRLGDVQRLAESTVQGGSRMSAAMAQRPGQMSQAVGRELDNIAPLTQRPYDVAPAVQDIGTKAMQAAEQMRTRAASPYYQAAQSDRVNPNAVRAIADQMDTAAAGDKTSILAGPVSKARSYLVDEPAIAGTQAHRVSKPTPNGAIYQTVPGNPGRPEKLITDIGNLDRSRKFLRDQTELPPFAAEAIPKEEGKVIGGLLDALRSRMERNSPNFSQGRQEYERMSRRVVEPMAASPTGQLANASTPEAQRAILFPQKPLPNSERGIGNAVGSIASRDAGLAKSVVRNEVERVANNTVRGADNAGRPDQFGGAKFAKAITDNPQYNKNLGAAMGSAGTDKVSLDSLVEVLRATGQRQRPGSLTAFNTEALNEMKQGGIQSIVQAVAKPMATAKETAQRMRLGSQSERLADLLLSGPEGVRRIQELAARGSDAASIMARALLSLNATRPVPAPSN
jgi:hypothetical protein